MGHAADGAFDYDVAVKQLGAIRAVFEKAVEFVYVLHGDLETLVAEQHVLHAAFEIVVGTLEEAVELVDMLEQNVGHVGHGFFEMLMQEVDTEDDLGNCFCQCMELCLWVLAPVAAVGKVPRGLESRLVSAQQLLPSLDASLWGYKGHMASLARGIEHRLFKGGLHGGYGVDGEGGRHDAFVALVLPCVGVVVVVFEARATFLGGSPEGNHGDVRIKGQICGPPGAKRWLSARGVVQQSQFTSLSHGPRRRRSV